MRTVSEIEDNVPIPSRTRFGCYKHKFHLMAVGQSVVVVGKGSISSAHTYGKAHGMKFVTRRIDHDTYRVWRVE